MASKNNFVELPVYDHAYRSSSFVCNQLINTDHIVRVYTSDNMMFENDTFIELNRQFNTTEPLRISLDYHKVIDILKSC
jgi:hypothetical protein